MWNIISRCRVRSIVQYIYYLWYNLHSNTNTTSHITILETSSIDRWVNESNNCAIWTNNKKNKWINRKNGSTCVTMKTINVVTYAWLVWRVAQMDCGHNVCCTWSGQAFCYCSMEALRYKIVKKILNSLLHAGENVCTLWTWVKWVMMTTIALMFPVYPKMTAMSGNEKKLLLLLCSCLWLEKPSLGIHQC